MKYFLIIGALVSMGLILVSGCGGDSAEASLTKDQVIKKAELICGEAEGEQFKKGFAYMEEHPGIEEAEAVVPAALPPIEKELQRLKDLPAPSSDQAELTEFFAALEKAMEETKKDPESALISKANPFERPNELAKRYGLQGCSGNP
jgi:hypothetical protein